MSWLAAVGKVAPEVLGKLEGFGNMMSSLVPTLLTNRANRIEAEKAREWQEKMWNKQNEYNLPINQRLRLEGAGINPNLAFGSAASTMSASVPGSPAVPKMDYNSAFSNYYERKSILASINMQKEATRREKLNNDMMEQLLSDRIRHDRLRFLSEIVDYNWNLEHRYDYLNDTAREQRAAADSAEIRSRIYGIEEDIKLAEKEQNWLKVKMLRTERNHLIAKYGYEDYYYNQMLNPYETSTIAGLARTIAGQGEMMTGGKLMSGIRGILGQGLKFSGVLPLLQFGTDISKYGLGGTLERYNKRLKKLRRK